MSKKTPNPAETSSLAQESKAPVSASEQRRVARLALESEQFQLVKLAGAPLDLPKVYPVVDASSGGMGIRMVDPTDLRLFSVGTSLEGTLSLRREKFPVVAVVRNAAGDRVGCEFTWPEGQATRAKAFREALDLLLSPESLGEALRPAPAAQTESGSIWYQGPSNTHLWLWRGNDGKYRRMAVLVLGNWIQWDEAEGLHTGALKSIVRSDQSIGMVSIDTLLLERDSRTQPNRLQVAKTLIVSSNLPKDLAQWCLRKLQSA